MKKIWKIFVGVIFLAVCSGCGIKKEQKKTIEDTKEKRAELIEKKHNVSPKKAAKIVEDTDLRRRSYHNYYTGEEWGNAEYYDICIDVSKVGEDGALRLIEAYINETGVL